jgi:hypothetical protein
MRYEDGSALLEGIGIDVCLPLAVCLLPGAASPLPAAPTPVERVQPVRQDGVAAGQAALECCRNGMPTGAVVRRVSAAFGLPAEIVAMHLGRARRKQRTLARKIPA